MTDSWLKISVLTGWFSWTLPLGCKVAAKDPAIIFIARRRRKGAVPADSHSALNYPWPPSKGVFSSSEQMQAREKT